MRKYLTASLIACIATTSLVGCGQQSQDVQVSEELDALLEQMSLLQYADAPIEGNKLEYTLGKEVDGVKVPGSTRLEAAYLDQALALLPQAEAIKAKGTDLQQQSANAIIGSIKADEAAFLIDEAERAFQRGARDVVALRSKLGVLREIQAVNNAVAGDRDELIKTFQSGLQANGANTVGIDGLKEEAQASAGLASKANEDIAVYSDQISDLLEKVAEYEALELKLEGQSRSAQASDKYDKLDQATTAAKEAQMAQSQAQKLEIDVWVAERVATLEEYKRQQLAGDAQSSTADLLGKLDGFMAQASSQTNIPTNSTTYTALAQRLADAKSGGGDDVLKAAAFLLAMSDYGTSQAADSDERGRLAAAVDAQVNGYLGVIGALEIKIAQIKLDRQRVADKLAEIEQDRQDVIAEFADAFAEKDALLQAAGFDRMAAAVESLKQAQAAVENAGRNNEMELMSVFTLHARALQQQSLSARSYYTTLSSIASAGPELLGDSLHQAISARASEMQDLLNDVATATGDLQVAVSTIPAGLLAGLDAESKRGQIANRQYEVYETIMTSLDAAPAGIPLEGAGDAASAPAATGGGDALVGTWRGEESFEPGQPPMVITMTFQADGVYTTQIVGPDGSEIFSADANYSVRGNQIITQVPEEFGGGEEIGTFEIQGDTLSVTDEDGDVVEMKRQ